MFLFIDLVNQINVKPFVFVTDYLSRYDSFKKMPSILQLRRMQGLHLLTLLCRQTIVQESRPR